MHVAKHFRSLPEEWQDRPWVYTLWCYLQLQESERVDAWQQRMARIEAAELAAVGFHEPNRLQDERRTVVAAAAAHDSVEENRARGLRLRDALIASHALGTAVDDRLVS